MPLGEPDEVLTGSKSLSSRIAQTDPALLGRTDATPVQVMVKLDYDSVATYQGSVDGLAATSPSVTGDELTGRSQAERAYASYVADVEEAFARRARRGRARRRWSASRCARCTAASPLTVPANSIDAVLAIPGVVAVQQDR